uniref:Alpha-2-HS-glycoprotein-like n=1 Tax=Stegastes partitus TaxID=144197 RepID=A0A3B4Z8T3_9TELE
MEVSTNSQPLVVTHTYINATSPSLPLSALLPFASQADMNLLGFTAVLGLLVGVWAQIDVLKPPCDSLVAEEVGEVAQDYLNAHHKSGFKHRLNRIEDIKVFTKPDGDNTYKIEIDLLETDCHVLDPTPVANCTVRPKALTAIEGDCDVVLQKVGGALTVTAFKCKTEESTEDMCLGCPTLLPLNHTVALDFVSTSLGTFNNRTENISYVVQEVGRMSSQIVAGGPIYLAEYVIVEANCTDDPCVPLNDVMASRGICTAKGLNSLHTVDCKMFPTLVKFKKNKLYLTTADPAIPPVVHATYKHGRKHHLLTAFHNPHLSGYLSAESAESAEVVPVVPVHRVRNPKTIAVDVNVC